MPDMKKPYNPARRAVYERTRRSRLRAEGLCEKCGQVPPEPDKTKCNRCSTREKNRQKTLHDQYKITLFNHYAPEGVKCACCGETEPMFLTLDHINGRSPEEKNYPHRVGGRTVYRRLVKAGLPEGFRILCLNCNAGRYRNGGTCPHNNGI